MVGKDTGTDDRFARAAAEGFGAFILGRNMFGRDRRGVLRAADGTMVTLTEGSTRPIAEIRTHAGIVRVERYRFEMKLDNAAMESFFSSLKTERTARRMYRIRDDAKADVFDYIERFYNPKRRHSTIG